MLFTAGHIYRVSNFKKMAATKVVVDNGAYSIKIGFNNAETPRLVSLCYSGTIIISFP